jgi:hypothetical protein
VFCLCMAAYNNLLEQANNRCAQKLPALGSLH